MQYYRELEDKSYETGIDFNRVNLSKCSIIFEEKPSFSKINFENIEFEIPHSPNLI